MKKSKLRVFEAMFGEPQEEPETATTGPVDTEKLATAEHILLFTDADIEPAKQYDAKKALLTIWQELDDIRQMNNVKVTMDTGGLFYPHARG